MAFFSNFFGRTFIQLKQVLPYSLVHEVQEPDTLVQHGSAQANIQGSSVQWVDYNRKMTGEQAIAIFEQMRKSDASIRSILLAIKLPMLRATWRVAPAVESEADQTDKEIAQFVHDNLVGAANTPKGQSWNEVLRHVLLMLDFGYTVLEKIWDVDQEGRLAIAKLAPRLPQTITEFRVDQYGFLSEVVQRASKNGREQELVIPGQYAMVFTYDKEGDNYWGVSLLRYLYKHWFHKEECYRINMVRLDRYGVGIPVAEVASGYQLKSTEKTNLENLLQGLRSHQRSYAILPEEIKIRIMTPENEAGGASGVIDFIDHQDLMIARAVLANFLTAGVQKHGNYGTTVTWTDMFLYALQSLAQDICDAFQTGVIKELCDLNFDMTNRKYPRLVASTLEDVNFKEFAASMYNLVLGQVITPEDDLEAHTRKLLGLPVLPEFWTRKARLKRGEVLNIGGNTAALTAPNITGKPSEDDRQAAAAKGEPTPGTKPSTTPEPAGPIRVPGELT